MSDDQALTIVLDRLLFSVPSDSRRHEWTNAIRRILGSLHDLTSLAVEEIYLTDWMILETVKRSPHLSNLVLRECAVGNAGAQAIADHLARLTTLELENNRVGDEGVAALAQRSSNLTALDLSGNDVSGVGAQAIAEHLPRLVELDLGGNRIGQRGAGAIARYLPGVTTLALGGCELGDEGVRVVVRSLPELKTLDLSGNDVGRAGAQAIAEHLPKLTSLNLWSNQVGDAGAQAIAEHLPNLTTLHLGDNQVRDAGAQAIAENLPNLTTLHLGGNQVGDAGAQAIAENLPSLTTLYLWDTGLGEASTRVIAEHVSNLTSLYLSSNEIGDTGAHIIAEQLPNLTSLYLGSTGLGDAGAQAIAERLSNLDVLDIWGNQVGDVGARAIAEHMPNLTILNLDGNQVGDVGARAIAEHMPNLLALELSKNHVGLAGVRVIAERLPNLTGLGLDASRVADVSVRAIVEGLPNLTSLGLAQNRVGQTGNLAVIERLPNLASLDLEGNQLDETGIRSLLDSLVDDETSRIEILGLDQNPGLDVIGLPELAESEDALAILASYRRLTGTDATDLVAFGEAKLVVLGNEAVGKTSLVRALVDGERSDPDEPRTAGVNHRIWVTPWSPSRERTQLNIWDFGGQEIMHQTHRYFLTERCIHLIVLDRRHQDDTSVYTWVETVAHRAPNSPVVIVINKCDRGTHNLDVDFVRLRREHPEVVDIFNVSCAPDSDVMTLDQSMAPLRSCIAKLLSHDERLSSVRARVPRAWVRVRDNVRSKAQETQVLGVDEFVNLCQAGDEPAVRVTEPDAQRGLLRLLHQIGVVVAHGLTTETTSLAGLTLLDPNWFTHAVYALLDYGLAEFDRNDLGMRLRKDSDRAGIYSDSRLDYIIDLLQQPEFALAFRLPGDTEPPRFLLPEALTPTAPASIAGWDASSLRLRFRYKRLPRGLIPQFQVLSHQHAGPRPERWRSGCILKVHGCPVLVDGQVANNAIDILVAGPPDRRRDALAVVRSLFDLVHRRLPESVPDERVPLPDNPAVDIGYQTLRTREAERGPGHPIWPEGADHEYAVGDLLSGVRDQPGRGLIARGDGTIVDAKRSSTLLPRPLPPVQAAAPPATPTDTRGGISGGADGAQVGGAVGAVLGCAGGALYLLGKGKGWPLDVFLQGGGIGTIAGAVLGFLAGIARRPG